MSERTEIENRDGFDAPVRTREEDDLNRWQLASEIYHIAVNGPADWSVRAGVYGEWGTGKTSVLKFIDEMANIDEHVVVWFDPWEHSTKSDLWRSFVLTVFKEFKAKFATVNGARKTRIKHWAGKTSKIVSNVAGALNANAGQAIDSGLQLVKKHLSFSQGDLASLKDALGQKRVIVLIDDLDRTAPELVPEILFALKDVIDIPMFSFICAFDPVVVGQVLRQHHPGFGDGLKFLEKIIDYPRWLPPASLEGLAALALRDAKSNCPFVPEQAVRNAVPLLPANPRAIRQFIRLLALLGPQIERHYDHELRWPVIIAANVLKVRYPQLAHPLLRNEKFWKEVRMISMQSRDKDGDTEVLKAIEAHVEETLRKEDVPGNEREKDEVVAVLVELCRHVDIFMGLDSEAMAAQVDIAEAPHAVTWKEFDRFFEGWKRAPKANAVQERISTHATSVGRTEAAVYSDIVSAAIHAYAKALHRADNATLADEKRCQIEEASDLIGLLESLLIEPAKTKEGDKQIGRSELELLFEKFLSIANSSSPAHQQLWPRNEKLLLDVIDGWRNGVMPLVKVIGPYDHFRISELRTPNAKALQEKLCRAVLLKLAVQTVERLREAGFIASILQWQEDTSEIRNLLVRLEESLWKDSRSEMLKVLADASGNRAIQENAYQLLHWFGDNIQNEKGQAETVVMEKLLTNEEIAMALWNAATATPLNSYAVARIREVPPHLKTLGTEVPVPTWWQPALDELKWRIKDHGTGG